jgi:hypothetical protein
MESEPVVNPDAAKYPRNLLLYALLMGGTIFLGLGSRRIDHFLPGLMQKNTGDVLWATMAFWLWAMLISRRSTLYVAGVTALFSLCVECFKFVHTPWLDAIRTTVMGHLIFGYAFSWNNLVCYLLGIGIAAGIDHMLQNAEFRRKQIASPSL